MRERVVSPSVYSAEDEQAIISLRPGTLDEYIGQKQIVEKLTVSLKAALGRNEPHEHILIDEIHRLAPAVEEFIYPAMEDFKVDFVVDKGAYARVINVPLKEFTFVGATTRAGLLSAPLRSRFGIFHHIDFYPHDELAKIVERSAKLLKIEIDDESCHELARRSRGTPRIALDRKLLTTIIKYYSGGPVGIEALAATINEETDTLEEMVEPFLLKIGFLKRTKRGRVVGKDVYKHLNIKPDSGLQQSLL